MVLQPIKPNKYIGMYIIYIYVLIGMYIIYIYVLYNQLEMIGCIACLNRG